MPMGKLPMLKLPVLLIVTCLLAGCGFHLRGSGGSNLATVDPGWQQMHLASGSPNNELALQLKASFSANGVTWVDMEEASYILQLDPVKFEQRYLSLSSQARAAELQLSMKTRFSVIDRDGMEILPPTEASVIQQMENDPGNVVGKTEEMRILRGEMRSNLVNQILRRVTYMATASNRIKTGTTGLDPLAEPKAPADKP